MANGYYTVCKGDSLWAIAYRHDVPLADLKTHNPHLGARDPTFRLLYPGERIAIPASGQRRHGAQGPQGFDPSRLDLSEVEEDPEDSAIASTLSPVRKRGDITVCCAQRLQHYALLPVRYAVARPGPQPVEYRYRGSGLSRAFPKLRAARYVLRTLREGYVYLVVDGQVEEYAVGPAGHLQAQSGPDGVEGQHGAGRYLRLPKGSESWLAFSEHRWTAHQVAKVRANEGERRTRQMQRCVPDATAADHFDASALADNVEEYAGRSVEFQWSDWPSQGTHDAGELLKAMTQEAPTTQLAIALHDPIGIAHELSNLLEREMDKLRCFVGAPEEDASTARKERYRKKAIAEVIEGLYRASYPRKARETHEDLERRIDQLAALRQQHHRKNAVELGGRPERPVAAFRRDILMDAHTNPAGAALAEHVDEQARRAFLEDYAAQVQAYQQDLLALKQDRGSWHAGWQRTDQPRYIGAAWETYDLEDLDDWLIYEESVARATVLMGGLGLSKPLAAQDPELALFEAWLEGGLKTPLYRALMGHRPLREQALKLADRSANITHGTAELINRLYRQFPYTVATEELVRTTTSYLLTKPSNWRGAVADNIDNMLARFVANEDFQSLMHALQARYGMHVRIESKSALVVAGELEAAAGVSGVKGEIVGAVKQGRLRTDGYSRFTITDLSRQTTLKPLGERYPNPFRGWGSAGVSGFVALLTLLNLKTAVEDFDLDNSPAESFINTGSAIASVAGAVGGGLNTFTHTLPRLVGRVTATRFGRFLTGHMGAKLFGYIGAAFSGITDGMRAYKRFAAGETAAGSWYAASALTVAAGSSALTYGLGTTGGIAVGMGPAGWIALGVLLLGISIYAAWRAHGAEYTPLEQWLDGCSFGKQRLAEGPFFAKLTEELAALNDVFYKPWVDIHWNDTLGSLSTDQVTFTLHAPRYVPESSELRVLVRTAHRGILLDQTLAAPQHLAPSDDHPGAFVGRLGPFTVDETAPVALEYRYYPDKHGHAALKFEDRVVAMDD